MNVYRIITHFTFTEPRLSVRILSYFSKCRLSVVTKNIAIYKAVNEHDTLFSIQFVPSLPSICTNYVIFSNYDTDTLAVYGVDFHFQQLFE